MTYAFDPTGKAVQNQIIGESKPISLSPGRSYLYIIPVNGPYFAQSLVIKYTPVVGAERFLAEGVDYVPSFQYADATRKINTTVYAGISFMDLTLDGTLTYSYQALGSTYLTDPVVITNIETTSLVDPVFTSWDSLVTLPAVPVVEYPWTTVNVDDVHRTVEELSKVGLVAHLRPKFLSAPGPEVFIPTPEEIGLGEVPNYPPATLQQALDGLDNASLMTPLTTAAAVEAEVIKQLSSIGYLVPVDYTGSIYIENERFTVNVDGEVYVIKDNAVPYTTSGVWANDSSHFELFQYAQKVKWDKAYITVIGNETIAGELGTVFNVSALHDSRVTPQLILNDVMYLTHSVDFKLSDDKLYVSYPIVEGDRLVLLTKRSFMSTGKDQVINKVFKIVDNATTFNLGNPDIDPDNLRVILNDFIILNQDQGDYTITNGTMTVTHRLAVGDVLEVENIDSSTIFGKRELRNILLGGDASNTGTGSTLRDAMLTGISTATTALPGTNTTQIATTAFVQAATIAAGAVPDASTTVAGKVELATSGETQAGIDSSRVVTPAGLASVVVNLAPANHTHATYAPVDSPAFTGTPIAPTAASNTNTTQVATTAFVQSVASAVTVPDASTTVAGKVALAESTDTTSTNKAVTPAHVKDSITQAFAESNKMFYEDLTIYVRTSGNDVLGTGLSEATAFASVKRAVEWCQDKITIRGKSKIIIDVEAGNHNYSGTIKHFSSFCYLHIRGAPMLGNALYGVSADGSGDTYKVTGNTAAARDSDSIFNRAKLLQRFATVLHHSGDGGSFGAICALGGILSLENILLIGDRTPPGEFGGGIGVNAGNNSRVSLRKIAIHNFGSNGINAGVNGHVIFGHDDETHENYYDSYIGVSNCGNDGIRINGGGSLYTVPNTLTTVSNAVNGINAYYGMISSAGMTVAGNGVHGAVADDCSNMYSLNLISKNNGNVGVISSSNSHIWCEGVISENNSNTGLYADLGGVIHSPSSTVRNNADGCLKAHHGGNIHVIDSTLDSASAANIQCHNNSTVFANGSTITGGAAIKVWATTGGHVEIGGTGLVGQTSPTVGVTGNQNGFISQ